MQTARDIVITRLVRQCRRFPDLDLRALDSGRLDARDAALAHAIDAAVRRRWMTLVAVIQSQLSRPWERLQAEVQAVLLAGSAQLLLLERLPPHAVLNESVSWAKQHVRGKAGGLVNAVLRRVADLALQHAEPPSFTAPGGVQPEGAHAFEPGRDELPLSDGRMLQLREPVFAEEPAERLAQQTSHATSLINQWKAEYGEAVSDSIAMHSLVHPPIIIAGLAEGEQPPHRNQTGGSGSSRVEAAAAGATIMPHDQQGFAVFQGDRDSLREMLARSPVIRVQDPGSAEAVAATEALRPRVIIDVCAGRGTKTRQLFALHPQARIIASDTDEHRRDQLRQGAAELNQFRFQSQLGSGRVEVVEPGSLRRFDEQADLLVLDVPCSNTGVLARRPEAKYRYSEATLQSLIDVQRQIVADSIPLLSPNGMLLYSTCSLEHAENQEQARWIERWHRMRIVDASHHLPRGLPGQPPTSYRDGGYWALLSRSAR